MATDARRDVSEIIQRHVDAMLDEILDLDLEPEYPRSKADMTELFSTMRKNVSLDVRIKTTIKRPR